MRRTTRKSFGLTIAGLTLPAALIWWLNRPQPPYEFIGPAPDVEFFAKADAERKPTIDVSLPLVGRVRLPSERVLVGPAVPPAYCGYLIWGDRAVGNATLAVDGWTHRLRPETVWENPVQGYPSTSSGDSSREVLPLPYATNEAYRDVLLMNDGGTWKLRLPVDRSQGSAHWGPMKFRVGPYTVTATPEPWRLTSAPFVMALTSDLPSGRALVLSLNWRRSINGIADLPEKLWMIEAGKRTYVSLPRNFDGIVAEGDAFELFTRVAGAAGEFGDAGGTAPSFGFAEKRVARAARFDQNDTVKYGISDIWQYRFEVARPEPLRIAALPGATFWAVYNRFNLPAQIAYSPKSDLVAH